MLEFNLLDKDELIRSCELIGIKNKQDKKLGIHPLERMSNDELILLLKKQLHSKDIMENISEALKKKEPEYEITDEDIRETVKIFKIKHSTADSIEQLKQLLYEFNSDLIAKAFKKMSKKKRQKLMDDLKEQITPEKAEVMQKIASKYGKKALLAGEVILTAQGVAIAVTGFNLGLSILFVQSLSTVSTIIGVTFPFAVYQNVAVAGGYVLGWGAILANPAVLGIIVALNLFMVFNDIKKKKYISIAGLNYIIESKKKMNELLNDL